MVNEKLCKYVRYDYCRIYTTDYIIQTFADCRCFSNILVILTAIAGTMYGQYCGLFTGVISGLFVDMMFSSIIGVNIFIYAVIGFIIGMTTRCI